LLRLPRDPGLGLRLGNTGEEVREEREAGKVAAGLEVTAAEVPIVTFFIILITSKASVRCTTCPPTVGGRPTITNVTEAMQTLR